ncbi:hypothetical protein EVAR_59534_1 [Eumeta japonica]|uniref:Uncharacterized protein n=1 Tax=Eumeta variegata TaxID=151549 RepID=A0A4C1XX81_EUMVA|nr:hypothetical protein EVAR_59534_1 [Eumeta japonica]
MVCVAGSFCLLVIRESVRTFEQRRVTFLALFYAGARVNGAGVCANFAVSGYGYRPTFVWPPSASRDTGTWASNNKIHINFRGPSEYSSKISSYLDTLKAVHYQRAVVAQWLRTSPRNRKVAGSILTTGKLTNKYITLKTNKEPPSF